MNIQNPRNPKIIVGLGNPGKQYYFNRHNIGFRVVDALADKYHASWQTKGKAEIATITINGHDILLVKPQTFMNSSGECLPSLLKSGTLPEEIIVVHDEIELPFGSLKIRTTGSAKGHNGLKSIIQTVGLNFGRLSFGVSRPTNKEDVPEYVLSNFTKQENVNDIIENAITTLEKLFDERKQ